MNNAATIAHRFAGLWQPCTPWPRPVQLLRPAVRVLSSQQVAARTASQPWRVLRPTLETPALRCHRLFSSSSRSAFQAGFIGLQDPASRKQEEQGLSFQQGDLSRQALHDVFGAVIPPPRIANRFLRVLHGRRNDGTLDLPLPTSLEELSRRYPYAQDSALAWLRQKYPIDEDAAIFARLERDEGEQDYSPSELQQRAQDVGLYEAQSNEYVGPQSGRYLAKNSEQEDDVFGQSELDKIRAENLAKAEREEEELQAQIDEKMAHYEHLMEEKKTTLAERPEQMLETSEGVRPPNDFDRWVLKQKNRAQTKLTLESPQVANLSTFQRLLPSAVFVALVCAGCYLFAQYWVPPKRSERFYPDIALSMATIGAIIVINLGVYVAWRIPTFWPVLNKYFVSSPGYPRALSMLGNVFSHHQPKHLLVNMFGLLLFGLSLHEDVGRGNFMAIYIASGAIGSLASLTVFSLRRNFKPMSLGASGSLWGVVAAYCILHAKYVSRER